MLKNYFVVAWRNLKRFKAYSFINITGFAIGLTICLIIGFYVLDDLTYDRFHTDSDLIFRVLTLDDSGGDQSLTYAITSGPLVAALQEEIPEVIASTRFASGGFNLTREPRSAEDTDISIRANVLIADHYLFDVFNFRLFSGEASALTSPNALFLTPEIAESLFGDEDPMGKTVQNPVNPDAFVAGIVEAPPRNSHIQFNVIASFIPDQNPLWWDSWENVNPSGYVRLSKGVDPALVESKVVQVARAHRFADIYTPTLQPLTEVHLGSRDFMYDFRNAGKNDASIVNAVAVIGILILVIASINFINLSSARAVKRAREVGLRKVVGSERLQLILQFLFESVFITLIAMGIALAIFQTVQGPLEPFIGKSLDINLFTSPMVLFLMLGISVIIGILAGLYPAFILSSFRPIVVLRGDFHASQGGVILRRILVVIQFAISIALIVGIFTIIQQIKYLRSMNMGYDREQVLVVFRGVQEEDILKQRLMSLPSIVSAGRIDQPPGAIFARYEVVPEGLTREQSQSFQRFSIDEAWIPTLGIDMAEGRNFSMDFQTDAENGVIINEAAARLLSWEQPVGRRISIVDLEGNLVPYRVVGVVKDFHYVSARQRIEPMVFLYAPRNSGILMVRIEAEAIPETVEQIEQIHAELFPDRRFFNRFLDDIFDQQFRQDRDFGNHLATFSGIAVFIACLGLTGLVSFAVEQRRKEIAVRKVLGSSESRIIMILASDFLKWVGIANLIAWPVGYLAVQRWLDAFAYRMTLQWWIFITAGVIALFIALFTISFQSVRAARTNPATALRREM